MVFECHVLKVTKNTKNRLIKNSIKKDIVLNTTYSEEFYIIALELMQGLVSDKV